MITNLENHKFENCGNWESARSKNLNYLWLSRLEFKIGFPQLLWVLAKTHKNCGFPIFTSKLLDFETFHIKVMATFWKQVFQVSRRFPVVKFSTLMKSRCAAQKLRSLFWCSHVSTIKFIFLLWLYYANFLLISLGFLFDNWLNSFFVAVRPKSKLVP